MPPVSELEIRIKDRFKQIDAPVLIQEMRIRQRGARPFVVLFVYVALLSAIALGILVTELSQISVSQESLARVGRQIFSVLSQVQLGLIVLIVPAYSAGVVATERDRGTFDLLVLTTLSSATIVRQKMLVAVAQTLMLVLASLPVLAAVFMLGGVSPLEILVVYALLGCTAAMLGGLGTLCSCLCRSTRSATFVAYLIPIVAFLGVPICASWLASVSRSGFYESFGQSPLIFTIMFALTGAIPSIALYGFAALVLSRRTQLWRTRAFRMGVMGGSYALLLLAMSTPALLDALINYSGRTYLQFIMNPFISLQSFLDANGNPGYAGYVVWTMPMTIAVLIGLAYLFERVSTLRFNGLRQH